MFYSLFPPFIDIMVDLVDRIDCIDSETLDSCVLLQQDEIAALEAIYDNLWTCVDLNKFEIKIYPSSDKLEQFVVLLSIQFTETYPLNEPPLFQISAPWMKPLEKEILNDILIECYLSNYHEPVVFKWITEINEFTESCLQHRKNVRLLELFIAFKLYLSHRSFSGLYLINKILKLCDD